MAWYSTGSIAVANGNTTVTGTGTNFISGAQVGEALYAPDGNLYEIASITSATTLVLSNAYLGSTASGQDYKIIPTQSLVADLSQGVTDLISDFQSVVDYAGSGKFDDGTVSSPAITFTQDQNNGLYRINQDNWGLVAGGEKIVDVSTNGIKLDDNNKATFGTGDDLQIYHDGTNSLVRNTTGNLYIQDDNGNIFLRPKSGQDGVTLAADGATTLFYSGNSKLATTSTGVDVTGTIYADGLSVQTAQGNIYVRSDASAVDFLRDGSNYFRATGASGDFRFATGNGGYGNVALAIDDNNDVYFYEDTGTTAKMVWDASAESLKIGAGSGRGGSNSRLLSIKDTGTNYLELQTDASSTCGLLFSDGNTGDYGAVQYNHGGDYLELFTASLERMRIDSSGNVGIGIASPAAKLDVLAGGDQRFLVSTVSDDVSLSAVNGANTAYQELFINGSTLKMATGGSERARIDSSGNLLVGTTTLDVYNGTSTGVGMSGSGYIFAGKSGDAPMYLNRISNDGDIAVFSKNGSPVGSIGATSSQLYIGSTVSGVRFGSSTVFPANSDGSSSDADTDLGTSSVRFKDLYLSGDIEIDGTLGKTYTQTSTSGNTSIIDTGIFAHQLNGAIFDVYFRGNANSAGSGLYRSVGHYNVIVTTDFNGSSIVHEITATKLSFAGGGSGDLELTLSAFFWDGTNEFTNTAYDGNNEIRLKISGYSSSGATGAGQIVKVTRRI